MIFGKRSAFNQLTWKKSPDQLHGTLIKFIKSWYVGHDLKNFPFVLEICLCIVLKSIKQHTKHFLYENVLQS